MAGLLVLPILFRPVALIAGVVGISMKSGGAWFGLILGIADIVLFLVAFDSITNSF